MPMSLGGLNLSFGPMARLCAYRRCWRGATGQDGQSDLYRWLGAGPVEALNFGQRAGLDMEAVLDTISGGAAQSWQMVNRGRRW